jgi:U3 small nucleolar RNA-associated protein 7
MVSAGQDQKLAVWDIRNYKEVDSYLLRQPGSSVAISDRGLTAVGWGTHVSIWKNLFQGAIETRNSERSPYMTWGGDGKFVERVRWCPLEDVLGVSHDKGFASVIVPGAGEPNFDALEVNPHENTRQRQEAEVKALLNKLHPDMISLNPNYIGNLDLASASTRAEENSDKKNLEAQLVKLKNSGRGRNSSLRKHIRKQRSKNIIDEKRLRIEALWQEQRAKDQKSQKEREQELGPALARFARKKG